MRNRAEFFDRCATILALVGAGPAAASAAPEQAIDDLLRALGAVVDAGDITLRQALIFTHLALLGRYPGDFELESAVVTHTAEGLAGVGAGLVSGFEFRLVNSGNLKVRLETAAPATLYVDATHTLSYAYNGGIPRVVRCLIREWRNEAVRVIRFSGDGRPEICPREEAARLLEWRPPRQLAPGRFQPLVNVVGFVKFHGAKWIGDRNRRLARLLLRSRGPTIAVTVPVFWKGSAILLPELVVDSDRVETWLAVLRYLPLRSTLLVHDLIPVFFPEFCNMGDLFLNYLRLLRVVDQVICVSEAIKQNVGHFLGSGVERSVETMPRVEAFHLGADFHPEAAIRKPSSARPLILCVGTLEPRKNAANVLRACFEVFRRGHPFRLIFAGNPGWRNSLFFRELARLQPLGLDVEVRTSVSDAELSGLYAEASFSVFCSRAEGFGLPVVEALACGIPCVTSDRGSMKEIAEATGACLLVDPESPRSIAGAIEALLTDADLLAELSAKARAVRWETWSGFAAKVLAFAVADVQQASNSRTTMK